MGAWYVVIYGFTSNPVLNVLWSVSVEEHFYLFAPWAVKYCDRKRIFGLCGLLIVAANVWLYYLGKTSLTTHRVWTNTFVQFECFAAGILLCLVLYGRLPNVRFWQRLGLIVGGWSFWFLASYELHATHGSSTNPGSWPLISGYGAGRARLDFSNCWIPRHKSEAASSNRPLFRAHFFRPLRVSSVCDQANSPSHGGPSPPLQWPFIDP